MKLHLIDIIIIGCYLLATVFIGIILRRTAQKNKKNYMLGGNKLPWYLLGLSNASGMFDISGTMWLVTLGFVYGLKSIWIPWLWPTFNQIFLMVFLSIWLRRSNATTGAEWIKTRFGTGRGSDLSHRIVVVYALISCLGFLAYGFIGLGKFLEIFIPWEYVCGLINLNPAIIPPEYVPHIYGIVFTLFAALYAILGGMISIVWADVLQYIIMVVASIMVGVIAMKALGSEVLNVPDGWLSPWFGTRLELDWSNIIPEVNEKIKSDGFSLFSVFFMMMLFKGFLVSAAGPAPNYDMQKILSTKTPAEGAKMSGLVSLILNPVRYFMITGFVVLALLYYNQLDLVSGGVVDFEKILPSAISEFIPAGLLGLMLAGLLAAFMSTFAGTLNAAQAYIVNDIYLKVKPSASNNSIRNTNYLSGIIVVGISILIGFFAKDVNSILQWIVSALWGSYVASNVLKWYWWRFNGHGYFWGMLAGLIPALIMPLVFKETLELYYFPLLLISSLIGCIIGTYKNPPTDENYLKDFYKNVKPWGFWKPIKEKVLADDPSFIPNKNFKMDMINILIGIIWQTSLIALPVFIVLRQVPYAVICGFIAISTSVILKLTWWNKLPEK
ncbi:MAG: sodium:solute symporter [Marinilabiliales bacterium]|nr:MAG: sodium:solute symporter [Marinilabiliales bacterium]